MRYFVITHGFETADTISITEDELEKAIFCHMTGKVGIFNNGTIRGSNIISIKEDWHKAMGWNKGYVLENEDFQLINEECRDYVGVIGEAKRNVQHLVNSGQIELIGKERAQQIDNPLNPVFERLADGMRI